MAQQPEISTLQQQELPIYRHMFSEEDCPCLKPEKLYLKKRAIKTSIRLRLQYNKN